MICVLGDAHLDVVVSVRGPVAEETDTPARTSVGVGGQASGGNNGSDAVMNLALKDGASASDLR